MKEPISLKLEAAAADYHAAKEGHDQDQVRPAYEAALDFADACQRLADATVAHSRARTRVAITRCRLELRYSRGTTGLVSVAKYAAAARRHVDALRAELTSAQELAEAQAGWAGQP